MSPTSSHGAAGLKQDWSIEPLFEPFALRGVIFRNRFIMSPMTRTASPGGVPGENVAAYYRRRAENAPSIHIRAVGRAEIGDLVLVSRRRARKTRVAARNGGILDYEVVALRAADRHLILGERKLPHRPRRSDCDQPYALYWICLRGHLLSIPPKRVWLHVAFLASTGVVTRSFFGHGESGKRESGG